MSQHRLTSTGVQLMNTNRQLPNGQLYFNICLVVVNLVIKYFFIKTHKMFYLFVQKHIIYHLAKNGTTVICFFIEKIFGIQYNKVLGVSIEIREEKLSGCYRDYPGT